MRFQQKTSKLLGNLDSHIEFLGKNLKEEKESKQTETNNYPRFVQTENSQMNLAATDFVNPENGGTQYAQQENLDEGTRRRLMQQEFDQTHKDGIQNYSFVQGSYDYSGHSGGNVSSLDVLDKLHEINGNGM